MENRETIIALLFWITMLALVWCIVFCVIHFYRLVKLGKVKDLSQKSGNVKEAIIYSNTTAMLPTQKESAYKHLPTYTAGIIYHIGTFLSLLFFFLLALLPFDMTKNWLINTWWLLSCMACFLLVSSLCGLSLLLKRVFSKKLRPISNFDDYFSNGIVTLFQLFTCLFCVMVTIVIRIITCETLEWILPYAALFKTTCYITIYGYFITAIILFLYLPFGKLKHAVYYFAARYHLGFFYGWRNTWKPKKEKQ